jgi:hypothetical protein
MLLWRVADRHFRMYDAQVPDAFGDPLLTLSLHCPKLMSLTINGGLGEKCEVLARGHLVTIITAYEVGSALHLAGRRLCSSAGS